MAVVGKCQVKVTTLGPPVAGKYNPVLGRTSLPTTSSKLVVDAIISELHNTLFSQNVFVLCVCWGENDEGRE